MARQKKIDAEVAAKVINALGHPMRIGILEASVDSPRAISPSQMAETLEQNLAALSYHVRMLVELGALKLETTRPKRGAIEHFYVSTPLGKQAIDLLRTMA